MEYLITITQSFGPKWGGTGQPQSVIVESSDLTSLTAQKLAMQHFIQLHRLIYPKSNLNDNGFDLDENFQVFTNLRVERLLNVWRIKEEK